MHPLRLRPRLHHRPGPVASRRTRCSAAGCHVIRAEKRSGTDRDGRTELQAAARFPAPRRHAGGHPHRPPGALAEGPAGHRPRAEGEGRGARRRPSSRSTPAPPPARPSSTCWACSPSSRPTCAASGSWKASRRPRPRGVYKGRKPSSIDAQRVRDQEREGLACAGVAVQGIVATVSWRATVNSSSFGNKACAVVHATSRRNSAWRRRPPPRTTDPRAGTGKLVRWPTMQEHQDPLASQVHTALFGLASVSASPCSRPLHANPRSSANCQVRQGTRCICGPAPPLTITTHALPRPPASRAGLFEDR